jgi:hypothetical protein
MKFNMKKYSGADVCIRFFSQEESGQTKSVGTGLVLVANVLINESSRYLVDIILGSGRRP